MALQTKGLWVEDLSDGPSQTRVLQHAAAIGAKAVYVFSTNKQLPDAIPALHAAGLKIYAWMWTHTTPRLDKHGNPDLTDPCYVPNEIANVVNILIPKGIDGYIFDVESDDGAHYDKKNNYAPYPQDWDNPNLKKPPPPQKSLVDLADDLTGKIQNAFKQRGTPYLLGLTSHARGFSNYPDIPWAPFLAACTVLFPQTYWRYYDGTCQPENADPNDPQQLKGKGTPEQAVINGYTDYTDYLKKHGLQKQIIPLAGEIGCATPDEITRFGKAIAPYGPSDAQFYVDAADSKFKPGSLGAVLAAIKAL